MRFGGHEMREEDRLVEKLRKIEALFARPSTEGERVAAGTALERIRRRLQDLERAERPVEYRFSLPDAWSKSLFIALLRRYGLKPYRYPGQRRNTVMVKVTATFVNETLWPEFQEFYRSLRAHLEEVTNHVISEAICKDASDVEVRSGREGTVVESQVKAQSGLAFE
jgi:hypothetical protein